MRWVLAFAGLIVLLVGCNASSPQTRSHPLAERSPVKGSGAITQLHMVDPLRGWAYGIRLLARTSDGASTFLDVTPPGVDAAHAVASPVFLDANRAIVIVVGPSPEQGALERTADGGQTWVNAGSTNFAAGTALDFVDLDHGWAVEQLRSSTALAKLLFRTTDGGATWSQVYRATQHLTSGPTVAIADCGWMGPPVFSTPAVGAVGLNCPGEVLPELALTNNGGGTWQSVSLPALRPAPGITWQTGVDKIQYFGSDHIVAFASQCTGDAKSCSSYGVMYESSDGGRTWSEGSVVRGGGAGLQADSPSHAFLVGAWVIDSYSPWLLVTSDAGLTWTSVKLPLNLGPNMHGSRDFDFADARAGFVLAWDEFAPATRFYRTVDGGHSFTQFTPTVT